MWWRPGTFSAGCRWDPGCSSSYLPSLWNKTGRPEKQSEGLKHNPHLMLIDDADRPAKWYFGLKAAHLEAKRTGGEMRHPLAGPVTLKWRS